MEGKRKFKVYVHTNKVNGKKYIGITGREPEDRWANGLGYKSNKHFDGAIQKYGWDNFNHEVLFEFNTVEEAMRKETELILEWKTNDPNLGYNAMINGTIGSYTLGKPANNRRKIKCIELNEIFDSVRIAASETGTNRGSITRCCQGSGITANGYHWEYVDEELKEKFKSKRKEVLDKEGVSRSRKVRCLETGEIVESNKVLAERYKILPTTVSNKIRINQEFKDGTHWEYIGKKKVGRKVQITRDFVILCVETKKFYRTIEAAAKLTKTDRNGISFVVKGKNKTAGGYHWKLVPIKDVDINQVEMGNEVYNMYKRIICIETGVIYANALEVEKLTGIKADLIHGVCKKERETTNNYHWEYYAGEVDKKELKKKRKQYLKRGNSRCRKVKCKETGETVTSYKVLMERYSMSDRKITQFIYEGSDFPDGRHWKYVGKKKVRGPIYRKNNQVIKCVETGKIYYNAKAVERATGVKARGVIDVLRQHRKSSRGLHWEYVDIKDINEDEIIGKFDRNKSVLCVETGVVYLSLKEAAKVVNFKASTSIAKACREGNISGGYHWKYIGRD